MSTVRLLTRPIASFHPRRVPALARQNYRREMVAVLFFSTALAAVEGAVIGVIVRRAFEGVVAGGQLNYVVALLTAAPEFANLTSFFWAALAHGREKVRLINALQVVTVAMVGVVAMSPRTAVGLYVLAAAVVVARMCMSGVVTLRSTVWRANYPRDQRPRITGKLATVQVTVVAIVGLGLGLALNRSEESFTYMLPAMGALGLVGVAAYRRVRVRRGRRLVRDERGHARQDRPTLSPASVWRVLRHDRHFAAFLACLFVLGIGNIMLSAPLIIVLRERFGLEYLRSILITATLPMLVMPWFIPHWARLLARLHVVRFRALHSWVFVASQGVILLAVQLHSLPLMYLGAVLQGIGYGGGTLAWNLGHLDFAPASKASQYMGVHVTLNGVRGLAAPFIAVGLYEWLERAGAGRGAWVFAFSVALCVLGALGFGLLAGAMGGAAAKAPREM